MISIYFQSVSMLHLNSVSVDFQIQSNLSLNMAKWGDVYLFIGDW